MYYISTTYVFSVHSFKENKFENTISGSILRKCVENPVQLDFSLVRVNTVYYVNIYYVRLTYPEYGGISNCKLCIETLVFVVVNEGRS